MSLDEATSEAINNLATAEKAETEAHTRALEAIATRISPTNSLLSAYTTALEDVATRNQVRFLLSKATPLAQEHPSNPEEAAHDFQASLEAARKYFATVTATRTARAERNAALTEYQGDMSRKDLAAAAGITYTALHRIIRNHNAGVEEIDQAEFPRLYAAYYAPDADEKAWEQAKIEIETAAGSIRDEINEATKALKKALKTRARTLVDFMATPKHASLRIISEEAGISNNAVASARRAAMNLTPSKNPNVGKKKMINALLAVSAANERLDAAYQRRRHLLLSISDAIQDKDTPLTQAFIARSFGMNPTTISATIAQA